MLALKSSIIRTALAAGAVFLAADGGAEAETRDPFKSGSIWEGGAYFSDDGAYSHCYLHASFPEGWAATFYLDEKRILEIELEEPAGISIDHDPDLTIGVDGRHLAAVGMWLDEETLWLDDWAFYYADVGPIHEVAPPLKAGSNLSLILDGLGSEGQPKTWTYTAALTGSRQAFSSLESCVAKNAGPAPAPAAAGSAKTSTGSAKAALPPSYYGAIAIGEYDDGLLAGMSTGHATYAEAEASAIETCNQGYYGACTARMYLDSDSPCGAVAGGTGGDGEASYGWATSGTESQAQIAALESCSEIAYDCTIRLSDCVTD
jgi:hypothetical protein